MMEKDVTSYEFAGYELEKMNNGKMK